MYSILICACKTDIYICFCFFYSNASNNIPHMIVMRRLCKYYHEPDDSITLRVITRPGSVVSSSAWGRRAAPNGSHWLVALNGTAGLGNRRRINDRPLREDLHRQRVVDINVLLTATTSSIFSYRSSSPAAGSSSPTAGCGNVGALGFVGRLLCLSPESQGNQDALWLEHRRVIRDFYSEWTSKASRVLSWVE